jgi:NADH-quinone oxidoreductase subunit E
MAWITKNSGSAKIERRDTPYLDQQMKDTLETEVVSRYPARRAAALPVLHAVQDKYGWLPAQALEEAAEFLKITPTELMDTASFYEMYFLQPKGKYTLWVCESLACELLNHEDIIDALKKKLNIELHETTKDGKFTLMPAECLGACGGAPCALVNEKLHECIKIPDFLKLIDELE